MPSRLKKRFPRWQRPDHMLAVATIVLMTFLFFAGLTAWLLGEQPSNAGTVRAYSTSANK